MNHGLSLNDHIEVRLQVRVAPSGVTHEVWKEGRWVVLDDYRSEKGHDPTLGRLGFRIQGNDEVRLHKDFSFVPAN
jgi:hypothetical protein